jgi:hypothetical protein
MVQGNEGEHVKPKIPMSQQGIEARLHNWALCQRGRSGGGMVARETRRSAYGGGGYTCMTNVVCNIMRQAAKGPTAAPTVQSKLDFEDAQRINSAWQRLGPRHRLLLRDHYVLARATNVICRELNIKHWPVGHFNRELFAAQEAIDGIVKGGTR